MENFSSSLSEEPETNTGISEPTPTATSKSRLSLGNVLAAIFNGLGIGLLLGVLLGLSISPVVSGVIATLSSLLAVLIGLNEKFLDPVKSLRIGSFGFFAVLGILLGLYLRANDPLSPSLLDQKNEYLALGFNEEEAKFMITGIIQADTTKAQRRANLLYSSTINTGACGMLVYASADGPLSETIHTFNSAGGTWKELAEAFQKDLSESMIAKALIAMRDAFCNTASGDQMTLTNLEKVRAIKSSNSVSEIEKELSAAGAGWKAIVDVVSDRFPENERKTLYLTIVKVLSHD